MLYFSFTIRKQMLFNKIKSVVENFTESDFELLKNISQKKKYKKDDYILKEGENCNFLWYIEKGAVKAYENSKGDYRTNHFFIDNYFFTSYYCWVTGKPSDLTFKVDEDSTIIEIDYPALENLCKTHHIFDTIGRKMAERIFVDEYQQKKLLLNATASERYEYLEKYKPEIFLRFSLKDIASYIGITDVSLSRIRKKRIKP